MVEAGEVMKTPLLDGISKVAWRDALDADASKVYELQSDFNPFHLYSSKDHKLITEATEEMKGIMKHYLETWDAWMNKYQDLGAGDTASADAVREYLKKIERIGWKDILEGEKPV